MAFFKGTPMELAQENQLLRNEVAEKEKLKAVSTLASGVAHEIRNPLTAIKTFCEYLPKRLDDRAFLENFSRIVGTEVNRIDGLINQLMDFAKPAPPQLQEVRIFPLIDNTLAFLNSKFIQKKVSVIKAVACPKNSAITADQTQIKQALLNIFLNAIDAMPQGGTLTVNVRAPEPGNQGKTGPLTITIRDTGTGIAREDLKNIFDPFFSKKETGTGLGLSITQGIIQEHGGQISVKSEVGKGTEFLIVLPATPN